jgi:hypothetical protein
MKIDQPVDQRTLAVDEILWLDGQLAEIMDGAMVDKEGAQFRVHELIGLSSLLGHGAESFRATEKSIVRVWPREAVNDMAKRLAQEVQDLQREARKQQFAASEQGVMSNRRHRDRDNLVSAQIKYGIADAAKTQGILRHWVYRFFGK